MRLLFRFEQEPPGEPRDRPWDDDGEKGEPGGDPRETPWPEVPASEPPGEPREKPWDEDEKS